MILFVPGEQIVAFTATQIPGIDDKMYPPDLAGELYPKGIPILSEDDLEAIVKKYQVDRWVGLSLWHPGFETAPNSLAGNNGFR
jgi:predicted GTPase